MLSFVSRHRHLRAPDVHARLASVRLIGAPAMRGWSVSAPHLVAMRRRVLLFRGPRCPLGRVGACFLLYNGTRSLACLGELGGHGRVRVGEERLFITV